MIKKPKNAVAFMSWDEGKLLTFSNIKRFYHILATAMGASLPCLRMRSGGMKGVGDGSGSEIFHDMR